jgi:hypothetical protein
MKVKIQRGSTSIEIEGDFDEVERVLDRWWGQGDVGDADDTSQSNESTSDVDKKKPRKPARKTARAPRAQSSQAGSTFDADAVAGQMKNDERYDLLMQKVILPERGRAQKVKLVSWFVGETPLTSGNVHRVLQRLGVKIDLSTVSRAMSGDAKHDYMVDRSGPQPTYTLTLRGRNNFEQWLLDDARAA